MKKQSKQKREEKEEEENDDDRQEREEIEEQEKETPREEQLRQTQLRGAFLVSGLPLDDSTIKLNRNTLHSAFQSGLLREIRKSKKKRSNFLSSFCFKKKEEEEEDFAMKRFQIFFDRTIHKKIRNGAFLVLFDQEEKGKEEGEEIEKEQNQERRDEESEDFFQVLVPGSALFRNQKSHWQKKEQHQYPHEEEEEEEEDGGAEEEKKMEPELITLSISRSAGKFRDHFFPFVPFPIRTKIHLDSEATYSLTDSLSAQRMSKLSLALLECGADQKQKQKPEINILDAFACCGGNTFGFLSLPPTSSSSTLSVNAIELDSTRCEMLRENSKLLSSVLSSSSSSLTIHNQCCIEFIVEKYLQRQKEQEGKKQKDPLFDIVFLDPPFGGTDYRKKEFCFKFKVKNETAHFVRSFLPSLSKAEEGEQENEKEEKKKEQQSATSAAASGNSFSSSSELTFDDLVEFLIFAPGLCSVVAIKFPTAFEDWAQKNLVERNVFSNIYSSSSSSSSAAAGHGEKSENRERVFPFLFNFGASLRLFAFVQNSSRIAGGVASNSTLDALVKGVFKVNVEECQREARPRFFDFEKRRWIELKKWLGAK